MSKKRKDLTEHEKHTIDQLISAYIDPHVFHLGEKPRKVARYDKREQMYGGEGTVYLLQLFHDGELVNNRIGAYMILPSSKDSVVFHTHGTRKEQELYVVVHGKGEYHEKDSVNAKVKTVQISKGSVSSVKGPAHHAVTNTGDEPLIVFVITTNE